MGRLGPTRKTPILGAHVWKAYSVRQPRCSPLTRLIGHALACRPPAKARASRRGCQPQGGRGHDGQVPGGPPGRVPLARTGRVWAADRGRRGTQQHPAVQGSMVPGCNPQLCRKPGKHWLVFLSVSTDQLPLWVIRGLLM